MAPGLEALATPEDEFLMYVDDSLESRVRALSDMKEYITDEGPFDALLAFSQGASCGASLLLHLEREYRKRGGPASPFKCAVFFCGGPPEDPRDLELGVARIMDARVDGEVLDLPTGHVWGRNDDRYGYGPGLSALCCGDKREVFVHEGGHEIPGVRDPEGVLKAVQVVKRTLARAEVDS
ncbi:uncharacterized protein LDX57_010438 [Aspergillus melleus]|uniref:uncharacterized protein n=1 Tax=Aspergillus melleus TaxID=138277 RepID=UPI001E8D65B4|nr:uncharacterized protein LDX57_010438 [Aspergillus melleus]KAH8432809.1 hypothetical protein LDX57_010438 [Aspergillus melleus]